MMEVILVPMVTIEAYFLKKWVKRENIDHVNNLWKQKWKVKYTSKTDHLKDKTDINLIMAVWETEILNKTFNFCIQVYNIKIKCIVPK